MIYCDNIIENNSIILRNMLLKAKDKDVITTSSSYACYTSNYEKPISQNRIYYGRVNYKYTTTNQSPTWVDIYMQGGMNTFSDARISNPKAGTEYTLSGYGTPVFPYTLTNFNVYNGKSSAINGVTAELKNALVYDVTDLYSVLIAKGIVTNKSQLVIWCNDNLEWRPCGELYDITDKIDAIDKVTFKTGNTMAEIIECDGMEYYSVSDRLRNNTYFDTGIGVSIYNNAGNDAVTFERVDAKSQNSPFYPEHKYILKITTNGSANPSCGGFYAAHTAAANKIFIEKFVAKIPVGYNISCAYNPQGTGASVTYLTPTAGTGKWEEYAILYKCGSTGTFSTGGHVYIYPINSSYSSTSVTWYVAYVNNCDITENEYLKNYTTLNNKDIIKGNTLFTRNANEVNIFPNGDGSDTNMTLTDGVSYDKTDVAGEAKASYVVAVNATSNRILPQYFAVNPLSRYKISFWVKCKGDMSNYLLYIIPYATKSDGTKTALNHTNTIYIPNTLTKLTKDLVAGDTQIEVSSNANWIVTANSRIGIRSNNIKSYNDIKTFGASSGDLIAGVEGSNIIKLKEAYTGDTITAGKYVVENTSGSYYIYPISKGALPTNNEWKYVEGYFGSDNLIWDGASTSGWLGLPFNTTHIRLGLQFYKNDGTVPIKYSDIKIEEIGTAGYGHQEKKIQFKKFN